MQNPWGMQQQNPWGQQAVNPWGATGPSGSAAVGAPSGITVAPPEPDPVDPESTSSHVGRAFYNTVSNVGATGEALGEVFDNKEMAEWGKAFKDSWRQDAVESFGTSALPTDIQDAWSDDQFGPWLYKGAMEAFGSIGAEGASGAVGGIAGRLLTRHPLGMLAGTFAGVAPFNLGLVSDAAKQEDPSYVATPESLVGGAGVAAVSSLPPLAILNKLPLGGMIKELGTDRTLNALVKKGVSTEIAKGIVEAGAISAATDAVSEAIIGVGVADELERPVNWGQIGQNIANVIPASGIAGGTVGGAASGIGAVSHNTMVSGGVTPATDYTAGASSAKPMGAMHSLKEAFGTAALNRLEPLAKVSPTAKAFVDSIRSDDSGAVASATTVPERARLMAGEFKTEVNRILNARDGAAIIDAYRSGIRDGKAGELARSIERYHATALASGLDIGKVDNYLPTHLDRKFLSANREQALQDFLPFYNDEESARTAIDDYLNQPEEDTAPAPLVLRSDPTNPGELRPTDSMEAHKDKKFSQGSNPPKHSQLEKARFFANVPQAIYDRYTSEKTVRDYKNALRDYFDTGSHRIAFAERFGPSGKKLNEAVWDMAAEAQRAGYPLAKHEVDQIYNIADSYNGMYGRHPDKAIRTAGSILSATVSISALPLATLSSLVEGMLPAIRGDLHSAIKSALPAMITLGRQTIHGIYKGLPPNERLRFLSEANLTLDAATNIAAQRVGEQLMTRGTAKVTRAFFMANGLSLWTHAIRTYAAETANQIMKRNSFELTFLPFDSPRGQQRLRQLRSMGIELQDNSDAKAFYENMGLPAETSAQAAKIRGMQIKATHRFAHQTALVPGIENTPLWQNHGSLGLLGALTKYPTAFTNVILPHIFRRSTAAYQGSHAAAMNSLMGSVFAVGMMLTIASMQDWIKEEIKSNGSKRADTRTDVQRAIDVVNASVAPIHVQKLYAMAFGWQRYGSNPENVLLGPVVSKAGGFIKNVSSFYDDPNSGTIMKTFFELSPLSPFRGIREWIKEQ